VVLTFKHPVERTSREIVSVQKSNTFGGGGWRGMRGGKIHLTCLSSNANTRGEKIIRNNLSDGVE